MRRFLKNAILTLVLVFLGTPTAAQAQYTFGGPGYGGFGYGGFGYGGFGFGNPGYGYLSPYSSGGSSNYYSPGWGYNSPFYPNGYMGTTTIITPGFSATDPIRTRTALYPAIPEPSREVILAALEGSDKDKARIEMQLPSADARVYLDGVPTKLTGMDRWFVTPKLNANVNYTMTVEVAWQGNTGREHTVKRQLSLRAGEITTLDLR